MTGAIFEAVFAPYLVVRCAPDASAAPVGRLKVGSRVGVIGHRGGLWLKLAPREGEGRGEARWAMARHDKHGALLKYIAGCCPRLYPGGKRPTLEGLGLEGTAFEPPLALSAMEEAASALRREVLELERLESKRAQSSYVSTCGSKRSDTGFYLSGEGI